MRITYRSTAIADMREIRQFYEEISERTALRVEDDIISTIEMLRGHPGLGRKRRRGEHALVTAKYRYVILYKQGRDNIKIIGVYRRQNRS